LDVLGLVFVLEACSLIVDFSLRPE